MVNAKLYEKQKKPGNGEKLKKYRKKLFGQSKWHRFGLYSPIIKKRQAKASKRYRLKQKQKKQNEGRAETEVFETGGIDKLPEDPEVPGILELSEGLEVLEIDEVLEEVPQVPTISNLRNCDLSSFKKLIGTKAIPISDKLDDFKRRRDKAGKDWNNNFKFTYVAFGNKQVLGCTKCSFNIENCNNEIDLYSHYMRYHLKTCTGCDSKRISARHFYRPENFCKFMVSNIKPKPEFVDEINKHFPK